MKKTFHRWIAALLMLTMVFSLAACSAGGPKNDKAFLKNLRGGLEARWKLSDKYAQKGPYSTAEQRTHLQELVECETGKLGSFSDYQFEDQELAALAERYLNALQEQMSGTKYFENDIKKYNETFAHGLKERSAVIFLLSQKYQLTVNDKYHDTMDEMLVNGENYLTIQAALDALEKELPNMLLEHASTKQYNYSFVNTSDLDLESLRIRVKCQDADGNLITTAEAFASTCRAGETMKDQLYAETDFAKASVQIGFLYGIDEYYTEFVDVPVKDELIIDIKMPDLPLDVTSYGYRDREEQKCTITSVEMEAGNWYNGKCSTKLLLSGTKTFDHKGDGKSNGCRIAWKLYDMDGAVMDSGTCYTSECTVGEQFKNSDIFLNNLVPGTYKLELMDHKYH